MSIAFSIWKPIFSLSREWVRGDGVYITRGLSKVCQFLWSVDFEMCIFSYVWLSVLLFLDPNLCLLTLLLDQC